MEEEAPVGAAIDANQQQYSLLLHDLKKLVNPGLIRAYQNRDLLIIPQLESVKRTCRGTSAHAVTEAIRITVRDAVAQLGTASAQALEALLALEGNPATVERRQQNAAKALRLQSGPGFKAHKQAALLNELVDSVAYLEEKGVVKSVSGHPIVVEWPTLQTAIVRLHARIDREFQPELLITMSGPGSFAAFYFLSLGSRDVPLVTCTTFPARAAKLPAHQIFSDAATAAGWMRLESSKWNVYVPDVISELPKGYRALILDDRVLTGESQRVLKNELESRFGLDVRRAAVITNSSSAGQLDWYGNIIDEDYVMPWGARRGRE